MPREPRSRIGGLLGVLATALAMGCGSGVQGQLVVTDTIVGGAVLEPDTCEAAAWEDYTTVILYEESEPHWEIELVHDGGSHSIGIMLFGRSVSLGACEHFTLDMHTDWEDAEVRGRLEMSCSLLAGGHIEGAIDFWGCR